MNIRPVRSLDRLHNHSGRSAAYLQILHVDKAQDADLENNVFVKPVLVRGVMVLGVVRTTARHDQFACITVVSAVVAAKDATACVTERGRQRRKGETKCISAQHCERRAALSQTDRNAG